ncbi:MAG: caspase family protein [Elusimicrobia bacterium]|nr:caspase family protein [Elusimicrobiota bacterium]
MRKTALLLPTLAFLLSGCGAFMPPMHNAIVKSDADEVRRLLASGVDVNEPFSNGSTPLHLAAAMGDPEVVRVLVEAGADLETPGYDDRTPFEHAVVMRNPEIAKYLKEQEQKRAAAKAAEAGAPPAPAAAPAPGGAVSRDEVSSMVAEAIAARVKAKEAAVIRSDADVPVYKLPERPDDFAVVVGVEKYQGLPEATFARRDAEAVRDHLLALGYPQRNVVLLTDAQATKTNWAKYLDAWLPEKVTARSTVFFYYSGHGAPDAATGQAYLLPVEGDPQYLEVSALRLEDLYAKLGALKAGRVLVAVDSCFSGAGGRSVLPKGARPLVSRIEVGRLSTSERIVTLTASAGDEVSGTIDAQGHGAFTYYLLKGLNGAAADADGAVTVSGLHRYLKPKVADAAREQSRDQTPELVPETSALGGFRLR